MIKLVRVRKVTDLPPSIEGFININSLSWFNNNVLNINNEIINLYEITPYYLRDENGSIFENFWQSTKIYRHVYEQKQIFSSILTWQHPDEDHIDSEGNVLPAYWKWRYKLMFNLHPVRYPNGYDHRKDVVSALWPTPQKRYESLTYVEARKKIYCPEYARLVQRTQAFAQLKNLISQGYFLQIMDVDVPEYEDIILQSDQCSSEKLVRYINNPLVPFGHSWVLSACLLNFDLTSILST
jgi:hypothetical protein